MKILACTYAWWLAVGLVIGLRTVSPAQEDQHLRPYEQNPTYWQYRGQPLLLLGGSKDDNLFQRDSLAQHLDLLVSSGGNYIRNTMSSRDEGNLWPYHRLQSGLYDLDQWNPDYWQQFEELLALSHARQVMVQIEVWDRFDYSRDEWWVNPVNPKNNIQYTYQDIGFDTLYPNHPATDQQPFFHTIPGLPLYDPKLGPIRKLQERFAQKLLSHTLKYDHVLYCMNNETTTPVRWGNYWIEFIEQAAARKGKEVFATDMYDSFHHPASCDRCHDLIAEPARYKFMDISQINSRNFGQQHWDTLQYILALRDQYDLRPANHTKVYGGNNTRWGSGSNADGVERFMRNIIGGCASARHHRPPTGNGLNAKAQHSIAAARLLSKVVQLWQMKPAMTLLKEREPNEAYVTAAPGSQYAVYFPEGGEVQLDLRAASGSLSLQWISVATDERRSAQHVRGGQWIPLTAPEAGGWIATIKSTE